MIRFADPPSEAERGFIRWQDKQHRQQQLHLGKREAVSKATVTEKVKKRKRLTDCFAHPTQHHHHRCLGQGDVRSLPETDRGTFSSQK